MPLGAHGGARETRFFTDYLSRVLLSEYSDKLGTLQKDVILKVTYGCFNV